MNEVSQVDIFDGVGGQEYLAGGKMTWA